MRNYYGRLVRIYEYKDSKLVPTGKIGRLLEIDVNSGNVMVEADDGSLLKLYHTLIKLL